ncbi:MAG: hypothetical protein ABUJ98_13395, partial [Hyphomicrobium sp.]
MHFCSDQSLHNLSGVDTPECTNYSLPVCRAQWDANACYWRAAKNLDDNVSAAASITEAVEEVCSDKITDVVDRGTQVQLSITGKGGRIRQVLLPETVATAILALRSDAGAND